MQLHDTLLHLPRCMNSLATILTCNAAVSCMVLLKELHQITWPASLHEVVTAAAGTQPSAAAHNGLWMGGAQGGTGPQLGSGLPPSRATCTKYHLNFLSLTHSRQNACYSTTYLQPRWVSSPRMGRGLGLSHPGLQGPEGRAWRHSKILSAYLPRQSSPLWSQTSTSI